MDLQPKVAIVGASIAGSICATLLHRLGVDVTVYERASNEPIPDRGAGIWLPPALLETLMAQQLLPETFATLPITERPIYSYHPPQEHLLTSHLIHAKAVHWLDLYNGLKQSRPEHKIIYKAEVTAVTTNSQGVELITKDRSHHCDYCIFTDGHFSLGRRQLFPELKPRFTDTIVWRGTIEHDAVAQEYLWLNKAPFFVCERGYLLLYPVPSSNSTYKINWLFYEYVGKDHPLFQGENYTKATHNIAKGLLPEAYRDYLHQAAMRYFPRVAQQVIFATEQPFIQAMHEMLVPSYVKGRCALLGDASTTLRPHTAAGATKAIRDALCLADELQKSNLDFAKALASWNAICHTWGKQQFEMGQKLGALFVTDMPDWQTITKAELDTQWNALVKNNVIWYAVAQ